MIRIRIWTILAALLLLGGALRLHDINRVSLRGDEAFTIVHWMRQPLAQALASTGTIDPQPPLAYALYRAWSLLIGSGEWTVRFLPALSNLVGIAALYALGKRLGGVYVGLVAALLWAVHPFQIWHAQDARNYAIWASLSLVGVWLALRAVEKQRPIDWVLYVTAACLAAYVYYLEVFTLFTLTLYVLIVYRHDRRQMLRWLGAMMTVGLILAPWYLQPSIRSGGGYGGTTGGFQAALLWERFLPVLNFGETLPAELLTRLWLALTPLLGTGAVSLWWLSGRRMWLPVLLGSVPLVLLSLVSLRLNVFTSRYVLMAAPAYVLLAASAAVLLWRGKLSKWLSVFLLGFWLMTAIFSLVNFYWSNDYTKSPDWRSLVQYLDSHADANDLIVQRAADEALNFYYDTYDVTLDRKQLPANPTQSEVEITALLTADMRTHDSIWLVAQTFPDWQSAGIVERWTAEHMQQVRRTSVSRITVEQYKPWDVIAPYEIQMPLTINFGDVVELRGARLLDPAETDDHLTLWLYWQPLAQTNAPLKIFVHLLGATNPATGTPLWTQADQLPQGGRISSDTWTPGDIYRDVYYVPLANVPPGEYTLAVGLYEAETGTRLPIGADDYYTLMTITLP